MKPDEYVAAAQRTSSTAERRDKMMNGRMGMIGEAGEIVDAVKKWRFQSGENPPVPEEKLKEELGDVLWYVAECCAAYDAQLSDAFARHREKLWGTRYVLPETASFCGALCSDAMMLNSCADIMSSTMGVYHSKNDWYYVCNRVMQVVDCARQIAGLIGATLEEVAEANIEKLRRRYPDGFDPERSLHREGEADAGRGDESDA